MLQSINWILITLGSILGSVILSITANLLTPHVQNWTAGRSLVKVNASLKQLESDLTYITEIEQNRKRLYLLSIIAAFMSLLFISLSLSLGI